MVLKIECSEVLRSRLRALGIYTGAKILLLKASRFKKSFLVQAGSGKIALGKEVAAGVRVWKL